MEGHGLNAPHQVENSGLPQTATNGGFPADLAREEENVEDEPDNYRSCPVPAATERV